jgi:hypothetical protein
MVFKHFNLSEVIMKHYLIALYIPWMLFFLTGCYASRQLTFEELKDYKETDDIYIASKKRQEFLLVNSNKPGVYKSEFLYCDEWEVIDDSIRMLCSNYDHFKAAAKILGSKVLPDWKIYTLSKSDIGIISRKEFDLVTTIFMIGIPLILLTGIIILFKNAGFGFNFNNYGSGYRF